MTTPLQALQVTSIAGISEKSMCNTFFAVMVYLFLASLTVFRISFLMEANKVLVGTFFNASLSLFFNGVSYESN